METTIDIGTVTIIVAPLGQGKTSTVENFLEFHREWQLIDFVDDGSGANPIVQLRSLLGLDSEVKVQNNGRLAKKLSPTQKAFLIWIDDAQQLYNDERFWEFVLRRLVQKLTQQKVPFTLVISATSILSTKGSSPVSFQFFPRISSVAMTDDEARLMLNMDCPYGLHPTVKYPELMELIIMECRGTAAAIRIAINNMNRLLVQPGVGIGKLDVTLALCMKTFFSLDCTQEIKARCFNVLSSEEAAGCLRKYQDHFVDLQLCPQVDPYGGLHNNPSADKSADQLEYERLVATGILTLLSNNTVQYASPLAMRVMCNHLFPQRALGMEYTSLPELVVEAIKGFSADLLLKGGGSKRPKEAVYQHFMMSRLCKLTPTTVSVLAELGYTFEHTQKLGGSLDFYLSGLHEWGLELLIDGSRLDEHVSRFSPGGKYSALHCKEHLVVVFRADDKTLAANLPATLMTIRFSRMFKTAEVYLGNEFKDEIVLMP